MGTTKKRAVILGGQTKVSMTDQEFLRWFDSASPQEQRNAVVPGTFDSFITDPRTGEQVRQNITYPEWRARRERGEMPTAVDNDPRAELARRADVARGERAAAQTGAGAYSAAVATGLPGIGAFAQDLTLGSDEEAAYYRMKAIEANPVESTAAQFASSAVAMGGLGMAVRSVAPTMLSTTGLKGLANAVGFGGAEGAYDYVSYLINSNTEFRAEEFGRSVLFGATVGGLIGGPIAARGVFRGAIRRGTTAGMDTALGVVADVNVIRALTTSGGPDASAPFRGKAAVFRMASRLARRIMPRKYASLRQDWNPIKQVDAAKKAQEATIKKARVSHLRGKDGSEIDEILDEVKGIAGSTDDLKGVRWDLAWKEANALRTSIEKLKRALDDFVVNTDNWTKGIGGKASGIQNIVHKVDHDILMDKLAASGWDKVAWNLKLLPKEGDIMPNFGRYVQARLTARMQRGITPGAAEADRALEMIINNGDIWTTPGSTKAKWIEIAPSVNRAIDDAADAYRRLDNFRLSQNLDDVQGVPDDVLRGIRDQVETIRDAYSRLAELNMLPEKFVRRLENKVLANVNRALETGGPAYQNIARLNAVRGQAAGRTTERYRRVMRAAPDYRARQRAAVAEEADRMGKFYYVASKVIVAGLTATGIPTGTGVLLYHKMRRDERRAMYHQVTSGLQSLSGSPELMEDFMAEVLHDASEADPEGAQMGGYASSRAMHYLISTMPRQPISLHGGLEPPASAQQEFLQRYLAVIDPLSVAYAALEGKATPAMVEAIAATNPSYYAEISNGLSQLIMQADERIARKTYNGIQMFLGGTDPLYRGQMLMELQSNYAQNQQQQQQVGQPPQIQGQFKSLGPRDAGNAYTFTQRIMSY